MVTKTKPKKEEQMISPNDLKIGFKIVAKLFPMIVKETMKEARKRSAPKKKVVKKKATKKKAPKRKPKQKR